MPKTPGGGLHYLTLLGNTVMPLRCFQDLERSTVSLLYTICSMSEHPVINMAAMRKPALDTCWSRKRKRSHVHASSRTGTCRYIRSDCRPVVVLWCVRRSLDKYVFRRRGHSFIQ
eukprot:GHVU01218058.1.p1 GENE.GHVU01218058.1~~GHVU01218058.1.p1  ORF type:complete len:115 (-),score=1.95 GHVU01218058.1:1443-1787(-)